MENESYVGKRFGRLLVVERIDDAVNPNGKHVVRYLCKCDCGNMKAVRKLHLTSGTILSCGCLHRENVGNQHRKHGCSHRERLYGVWLNMKSRCTNPNNTHYKSYGGRGITICDEWMNDFSSFKKWCIANGYTEEILKSGRNNITIDRIDVNGNYEPSNCRFVTNRVNCQNKRNSMSYEERNSVCPICGNVFVQSKRNAQKTCGRECGIIMARRTMELKRGCEKFVK